MSTCRMVKESVGMGLENWVLPGIDGIVLEDDRFFAKFQIDCRSSGSISSNRRDATGIKLVTWRQLTPGAAKCTGSI